MQPTRRIGGSSLSCPHRSNFDIFPTLPQKIDAGESVGVTAAYRVFTFTLGVAHS
jgi:hypothetical protein